MCNALRWRVPVLHGVCVESTYHTCAKFLWQSFSTKQHCSQPQKCVITFYSKLNEFIEVVPHFRAGFEQDSHEFLRYMLAALQKGFLLKYKGYHQQSTTITVTKEKYCKEHRKYHIYRLRIWRSFT